MPEPLTEDEARIVEYLRTQAAVRRYNARFQTHPFVAMDSAIADGLDRAAKDIEKGKHRA